jgi:hypothetical protein
MRKGEAARVARKKSWKAVIYQIKRPAKKRKKVSG